METLKEHLLYTNLGGWGSVWQVGGSKKNTKKKQQTGSLGGGNSHIFGIFTPKIGEDFFTHFDGNAYFSDGLVGSTYQSDDQSKLCQELPEHVFLPQVGSGRP